MKPTFCVRTLTEKDQLRIHGHNGTHVACHGERVFMTCVTGEHKITTFMEGYKVVNRNSKVVDGEVEAVGAVRTRNVHWLMLSKEEIVLLAERGMCLALLVGIW